MITARARLCMVIGDPVEHSLSPLLHNSAYQALAIDNEFVFVGCQVSSDRLTDLVAAVRTLNVRGVSCTMPHKETILPLLDKVDPVAERIGAANTVVNENGNLTGYNTDWQGIVTPLERLTPLKGKRVAIIGAGGSAKAAVYGLSQAGAKLTIFNRTVSKARELAERFDCAAAPLDDTDGIRAADIICNMTPAGMGDDQTLPVPAACLRPGQIVFDAVYHPLDTPLLKAAKAAGAQTLPGAEMLLHQALPQFALYTGREAPEAVMRDILYKHLRKED